MPEAVAARRSSRWILGLAVGAVAMALAFLGVPFGAFVEALSELRPVWLLAMAALFLVQEFFRAWRQVVLVGRLPGGGRLGMLDSLTVIFVSYFCIHLFPARLGEAVRPVMLRRVAGLPLPRAVGLVVAERVIDLVAALVMLLVVLEGAHTELVLDFAGRRVPLDELGRVFGLFVVLPALLGAVALAAGGPAAVGLARRLLERRGGHRLAHAALALLASFVEGFASLRAGRRLIGVVALTAATWAATGTIYWTMAIGFGIHDRIGIVESIGVMVITMLAALLPAPPGMAGVQEASGRAALALFGVRGGRLDAVALAYAVVVHWWQVVVQALGAAWFLRRAGTRLADLRRLAAREAAGEGAAKSG